MACWRSDGVDVLDVACVASVGFVVHADKFQASGHTCVTVLVEEEGNKTLLDFDTERQDAVASIDYCVGVLGGAIVVVAEQLFWSFGIIAGQLVWSILIELLAIGCVALVIRSAELQIRVASTITGHCSHRIVTTRCRGAVAVNNHLPGHKCIRH